MTSSTVPPPEQDEVTFVLTKDVMAHVVLPEGTHVRVRSLRLRRPAAPRTWVRSASVGVCAVVCLTLLAWIVLGEGRPARRPAPACVAP